MTLVARRLEAKVTSEVAFGVGSHRRHAIDLESLVAIGVGHGFVVVIQGHVACVAAGGIPPTCTRRSHRCPSFPPVTRLKVSNALAQRLPLPTQAADGSRVG